MTKASLGITGVIIVIILIGIGILSSAVGVWNRLNRDYQAVEGGKSHYSAALNTCTEKIKGVWEVTNQYMKHESETFTAVARARSGYETAREAFENAAAEGKSTEELTKPGRRGIPGEHAQHGSVGERDQDRAR
jgi:hypothetical protein